MEFLVKCYIVILENVPEVSDISLSYFGVSLFRIKRTAELYIVVFVPVKCQFNFIIINQMTRCGRRVSEHLTSFLHLSGLYSVIEFILLQVKSKPMSSNLKTRNGHGYVAVDSMEKTLCPGC